MRKLITKEIQKRTPVLGATDGKAPEDIRIAFKLFGGSRASWYVIEADFLTGEAHAWCDLGVGCPELGSVSLTELSTIRFPPFGLHVERDKWWDSNTTLAQVMRGEVR